MHSDLGIFISRRAKSSEEETVRDELEKYTTHNRALGQTLDTALQDRAQKKSYHAQILGEITRQEALIAREGGSFSEQRDELKSKKLELDHDIEAVKGQIRDLCSNLLPFAITTKYCQLFKQRLLQEEKYLQWKHTQKVFTEKVDDIAANIFAKDHWEDLRLPEGDRNVVITRVLGLFQKQFLHDSEYEHFKPIHNLSPKDTQRVLQWIENSEANMPQKLKKYTDDLEALTIERSRVEQALHRAPEDDVLGPLIQKLNRLNKELGQYEEQIHQLDEKIRGVEYKIAEMDRSIEDCFNKLKGIENITRQVDLANTVRQIVSEYSNALQKSKIREFEGIYLSCFKDLLRKGEFITDVHIDINTFSLTLYNRGGQVIPKSNLSVGEKQIYAVAMLWAMTRASRRPLPFIIDTPLGRLDSEHRGNLVNEFFPKASHQMIIFSTDTEIDLQYFKELQPFVSRSYRLDYIKEEGATKVTDGYFWENNQEEVN